jgi:hypothetical protein
MTQPTKAQTVVAIGALRADAGVWAAMAAEVSLLAEATAGLVMSETEFSTGADLIGVTDKYNELQQKVTGLLKEGTVVLQGIAVALTAAADVYQREEDAGVVRLNNINK